MTENRKYMCGSKLVFILLIAFSLVAGIGIGLFIRGSNNDIHAVAHVDNEKKGENILLWTCSMHPHIKKEGPGLCPICRMELTPMKEDAGGGGKASLKLGARARQLASVKTMPVGYKELIKSIYTVGKINYDESRVSHVTSWIGGRIDKLYVNFTGTIVQKDEHLVYIYSPELVSAQDEYLIAYRGLKRLQKSSIQETVAGSSSLLENTRDKLLLWGIKEDQIKRLEQTQKAETYLTIFAPSGGTVIDKNIFEGMYVKTGDRLFTIADLSRVWLYLDIYEYDLPWITYGQGVEVSTESFPGEAFHGTVVFIDPFLDEDTRAVRVRVNMDNRNGKLKPGMFANAVIKAKFGANGIIFDTDIAGKYMCPMHPDIISDQPDNCQECGMRLEPVGKRLQSDFEIKGMDKGISESSLHNHQGVLAVPHSAVLYTGLRNIVYVEKEEGLYEPREVKLGPKADIYYHVISGLKLGERVVTNGNFLIDSQMQLLGKPSLLFSEGSEFNKEEDKVDKSPDTVSSASFDAPLFRNAISQIIDVYFSIRTKLANDSIDGIEKSILSMEEKVKKIKKDSLDLPEGIYKELIKKFTHMDHKLAGINGKSLDETRNAFKNISKDMREYVEEFHYRLKGTEKVYIFFCPMANASWVQKNGKIGNPYFGSKMLKCGTLENEVP